MIRNRSVEISGYLTVYLALTMAVLLSLYLALIEGVRWNALKMEAEIIADIGLNSVLAEYHRELYRQYNLFAIDTSYGTPLAGKDNVEKHLQDYLEQNMSYEDIFLSGFLYKDFLGMSLKELELTKVSILTDDDGAVFRQRAIEAIKDDVGLALMEELADWMKTVSDNRLNERDIAAEKQETDKQIEEYDGKEILVSEEEWETVQVQNPDGSWRTERIQVSEEEWETVEIENPTDKLEQLRQKGVLQVVVDDPEGLSDRSIYLNSLVGARMEAQKVNQGNWQQEELTDGERLTERFLFQEYLVNYMGSYGNTDEKNALQYQLEYLVSGKESDVENLYHTATMLCAVRGAANAIYLFADEEKCEAANILAVGLATLMMVPEIADLLKVTLLLGWAYAESLYDVEILLEGGRIPLLKDDDSWHYDLDVILQMGNVSAEGTGDLQKGLSYVDYLRIFMSLTDLDTLTMRAMNMVEADIRKTAGNTAFRLDACYDCIASEIKVESVFGYRYGIVRSKKY